MKPDISVIMSVYNGETYIKRCVESVIKQTYANWELIVIDDGSMDNSFAVLTTFKKKDKRIYVMQTENNGVCSARNYGIELSQGEYITFLDADDELEPWTLEKLYLLCSENNSDIAIGQCKRILESGKIIGNEYPHNFEIWKNKDAIKCSLEDHPATYSVWGKLYKKSFVGKTRFDIGHKVHEDSFFLFELFIKNPTVVVKNIEIYRYHVTSSSASRTIFSEKFFDITYFMNRKKQIIEKFYPEFSDYVPNLVIKANMALLNNLCKTKDSTYLKVEKLCCKEILYYKERFKPATEVDKKWFWIISHHLYKPYKFFKLLVKK